MPPVIKIVIRAEPGVGAYGWLYDYKSNSPELDICITGITFTGKVEGFCSDLGISKKLDQKFLKWIGPYDKFPALLQKSSVVVLADEIFFR